MRRLTLYARAGCHLCDAMERALRGRLPGLGIDLTVVEIAGSPELEGRYGHKVPVLCEGEEEICHYFLDEEALAGHLAAPGA